MCGHSDWSRSSASSSAGFGEGSFGSALQLGHCYWDLFRKKIYLQLRNWTSLHPGMPCHIMQWGFHPHVSYLKTVLCGQQPCKLKVIVKWLLNKVMTKEFGRYSFYVYFSKSTKNQAYHIHWFSAGWQKFPERLPQDFETTHVHLLSRKKPVKQNKRKKVTRKPRMIADVSWYLSIWFLKFLAMNDYSFFFWHRQCQSSTKAWNHCFYFLSCCTLCVRRRGH